MIIRWQLTPQDMFDIARLELRLPIPLRLLRVIFFLSLIAGFLFAFFLFLVYGSIAHLAAAGVVALLLLYFPLNTYVLEPRKIRRVFTQSRDLRSPIETEIDSESLRVRFSSGATSILWSELVKWKQDDRWLLLYSTDVTRVPIPKSAISDSDLHSLIMSKIAEHKIPYANIPSGALFFAVVQVLIIFSFICVWLIVLGAL